MVWPCINTPKTTKIAFRFTWLTRCKTCGRHASSRCPRSVVFLQSGVAVNEIGDPANVILACEKPDSRNDSMVGVVLVDGSVQMLTLEEFNQRVAVR